MGAGARRWGLEATNYHSLKPSADGARKPPVSYPRTFSSSNVTSGPATRPSVPKRLGPADLHEAGPDRRKLGL